MSNIIQNIDLIITLIFLKDDQNGKVEDLGSCSHERIRMSTQVDKIAYHIDEECKSCGLSQSFICEKLRDRSLKSITREN